MRLNLKCNVSSHYLNLNQVFLLYLIKQVKMWYHTRQVKMAQLQLKSMNLQLISNPTLTPNSASLALLNMKFTTKLKSLFLLKKQLKNLNKTKTLKSLTKDKYITKKNYPQILKEIIFKLYMKCLWIKRRLWTKKLQPLTNAKKKAIHLQQSTKNQFKALTHIKTCKKQHILLLCLRMIFCYRCFRNHKCQLLICMKLIEILSMNQTAL